VSFVAVAAWLCRLVRRVLDPGFDAGYVHPLDREPS
jgi:hypothetical protein